jgi:hypothetical protein
MLQDFPAVIVQRPIFLEPCGMTKWIICSNMLEVICFSSPLTVIIKRDGVEGGEAGPLKYLWGVYVFACIFPHVYLKRKNNK